MIFTDEELKGIDVEHDDEWMMPTENYTDYANVMLSVYEPIKKKACDFFGIDYEEVIINGWIDVYAFIDVEKREVTSIYWSIVPNNDDVCEETCLEVKALGQERRDIFNQLAKDEEFYHFIEDCVVEIEKEKTA